MSLERLAGGAVLVDDLLLDPTLETLTAALFGGPPLHRVRTVLCTAPPPPGVPGHVDGEHRGATWTARRQGDGWLVESTTEGVLLHCPAGRADVAGAAALTVANPAIDLPEARRNQRVLVTGGTRSGKSDHAESLLTEDVVHYVATGPSADGDEEWAARLAAHRRRRPEQWRTLESLDVAGVLRSPGPPVLVDDLGTWTSGVLDETGGWDGDRATLHERQADLLDAFATTERDVVLVSDEVGDGVVPEHPSGRTFRDELGGLTARIARRADVVWRVTVGIPTRLR